MKNYLDVRDQAQKKANETGYDYGLSKDFFGDWSARMLPRRENRFGHELQCEVVMCETLDKCQPGHGPRR